MKKNIQNVTSQRFRTSFWAVRATIEISDEAPQNEYIVSLGHKHSELAINDFHPLLDDQINY